MVMTFYPHLPNNYKDWEDYSFPTHASIKITDRHSKSSRRGNKRNRKLQTILNEQERRK